MPTYGYAKTRTIIRGSLASHTRKGARDSKRIVKKRHRGNIRQNLRAYARGCPASAAIEDYVEDGAAFDDRKLNEEIRDIVSDRQSDNLGAVFRWAPKLVADVRLLDRYGKLRKRLPDTVAGRHARQHLEFSEEICPSFPHEFFYRRSYYDYDAPDPYWTYHTLSESLVKVLEKKGEHKRFNQYLKTWGHDPLAKVLEKPPIRRLFLGYHDIEPFIDEVFGRKNFGRRYRYPTDYYDVRSLVTRYFDLADAEVSAIARWIDQKD